MINSENLNGNQMIANFWVLVLIIIVLLIGDIVTEDKLSNLKTQLLLFLDYHSLDKLHMEKHFYNLKIDRARMENK